MRAIVSRRPGPVDGLKIEEMDKPTVAANGVLVRVQAASVNPADFFQLTSPAHFMRFASNRFKSKPMVLGTDFAGTVETVGTQVTHFRPGDEVFGGTAGAFTDHLVVAETGAIVKKPANVSFEQAAATPIAAVTALQALRDHGRVQPGQRILINGASGGVGTFAIQLAKHFGASITAVCSTRNLQQACSLGADRVIDYAKEDFTKADERYDLVIDIAGSRSWPEYRRILHPHARFVIVGGSSHTVNGAGKSIGQIFRLKLGSMRATQKVIFFIAKLTKSDLSFLAGLLERGQLRSVIDRSFELNQVPEAMRYMAEGHARGKILIQV